MAGRVQKEINRKKRTEYLMAQRTGKSAEKRKLEAIKRLINKIGKDKLKEYLKKKKDWRKSIEL